MGSLLPQEGGLTVALALSPGRPAHCLPQAASLRPHPRLCRR